MSVWHGLEDGTEEILPQLIVETASMSLFGRDKVVKESVKITKGRDPVMVVCTPCLNHECNKCNGKAGKGKYDCLCKFNGHPRRAR